MILLDANVFMYAAGADHPHKAPSLALLARVASEDLSAAVDAEVLQEILHRYRALGRWRQGRLVYDLARRIVPEVLPVTAELLDVGRELLDAHPELLARDALHAAACKLHRAEALCSYDRDFDALAWLRRIEPRDLLD